MPCDSCSILLRTASEPDNAGKVLAGLIIVAIPAALVVAAALHKG